MNKLTCNYVSSLFLKVLKEDEVFCLYEIKLKPNKSLMYSRSLINQEERSDVQETEQLAREKILKDSLQTILGTSNGLPHFIFIKRPTKIDDIMKNIAQNCIRYLPENTTYLVDFFENSGCPSLPPIGIIERTGSNYPFWEKGRDLLTSISNQHIPDVFSTLKNQESKNNENSSLLTNPSLIQKKKEKETTSEVSTLISPFESLQNPSSKIEKKN